MYIETNVIVTGLPSMSLKGYFNERKYRINSTQHIAIQLNNDLRNNTNHHAVGLLSLTGKLISRHNKTMPYNVNVIFLWGDSFT